MLLFSAKALQTGVHQTKNK